jgi:hypothetical protein
MAAKRKKLTKAQKAKLWPKFKKLRGEGYKPPKAWALAYKHVANEPK